MKTKEGKTIWNLGLNQKGKERKGKRIHANNTKQIL